MNVSADITIMHRQIWQYIIGLLSIVGTWYLTSQYDFIEAGSFLGLSTLIWFWLAILIPILHQIIISPLWRAELLNSSLTKFFGSTEKAFLFFKIIFSIFFVPRMIITLPLAISSINTINNQQLRLGFIIIGLVITPFILYGMYSVKQYFGINRAFGADHFFNEYRSMPLVKDGIFKYTDNAMYTIVLGFVLLPGLFLGSYIAIIAGIFNQGFVWVHYYTTEKPDMNYIYNNQ